MSEVLSLPALLSIEYLLLSFMIVPIHELLHYVPARLFGYNTSIILGVKSLGFYIEDSEIRSFSHVIIINMSPQLITVSFILVYLYMDSLTGLVFLLSGLTNLVVSLVDFYEVVRFYKGRKESRVIRLLFLSEPRRVVK